MINIFTIGFSQKKAEDFFSLLTTSQISLLIDIRLNNKSQLSGFTNIKHFPYFLKLHKINYMHELNYAPTKEILDNYKKKNISWEEYEKKYNKLLVERRIIEKIDWSIFNNSVLLCSESSPENCHRRLLAEYLYKYNQSIEIVHL